MKPAVFNQTKNLALANIKKGGGSLRREHLDRRLTLRAKRRQFLLGLPQDDRFLDLKGDFRLLFHPKKFLPR